MNTDGKMGDDATAAAAERKRKRLEAWRKRQQQQQEEEKKSNGFQTTTLDVPSTPASASYSHLKVKIGLGLANVKGRKKKKRSRPGAGFLDADDEGKNSDNDDLLATKSDLLPMLGEEELINSTTSKSAASGLLSGDERPSAETITSDVVKEQPPSKRRRKGRWDMKQDCNVDEKRATEQKVEEKHDPSGDNNDAVNDALDAFMMGLETEPSAEDDDNIISGRNIDSSGSMARAWKAGRESSSATTSLAISQSTKITVNNYTSIDWDSDTPPTPGMETDDEEEENARRLLIEELKSQDVPNDDKTTIEDDDDDYETMSEVKSEKERREDHVRKLEREAEQIRKSAHIAVETGRMYNDEEGGIMEEAERNLAALTAAPDALEVLAEMNKKKELRAVDHKSIEYLTVRKNLYIVPQSLAKLTPIEIAERRAKLGVKVRGRGAPAPVSSFREAGLSERIMTVLEKKAITEPFPVQAQCLPCIMAGRDVIGIAKTGSGKTLAFVLPMLRHILDQPPLGPNETGPIGLILAPARELAYQIHAVCKGFSKHLNIKSTAVYGGAGVAEQIGDLKRGTHILCATPGRLIDILTMQSGKLISLQRVSMVCLDECDRAFDMGFEPQISAILSAVRPDRQLVLFSATFPRVLENLAKKSLKAPLEIIVGGRSVASDSVEQYAEVVEEEDKFLRLLQILGDHANDKKKVIVFVGRQEQADSLFEQLTRCGYSSLSIHGGLDQEDRDSNLSDFKRADSGVDVLVATSVAGRGLDVPSCGCVVNYSSPNHLEDYVHRVGRTGRAGNVGVSYTFVNSTDEAKFAPIIVRALVEAGQSKNLSQELKDLAESFEEKVAKGEARWASSGYQGKGYTYDSSEMNDAQKLAKLEKREALVEAGLLDPDEEIAAAEADEEVAGDTGADTRDISPKKEIDKKGARGMLANVSSDVLAIPGMREALLKKAGMLPSNDGGGMQSTGDSHFVEELEINDFPREARWKVTQKETTSRLQDEFQTAVTLKGQYVEPGKAPADGERKLYLHLEAQSRQILQNCIVEVRRLLNEETLRVGSRPGGGGGRYSVL
jgi:ATP-dependent RNA helicase DDX46/PRP5